MDYAIVIAINDGWTASQTVDWLSGESSDWEIKHKGTVVVGAASELGIIEIRGILFRCHTTYEYTMKLAEKIAASAKSSSSTKGNGARK